MPKAPKPCVGCGGPKPRKQGIRYCDACTEQCPTHGRSIQDGCKTCRAAYMRSWVKRSPESIERNRQRARAGRFGLTIEEVAEYERIRACEVCGSDVKLCIDHNHTTGEIRGILCSGCNSALGLAGDNPERLRALAEYLDNRGAY